MGSGRHGAGALEDSLRPVTDSLLDELCAWLRIPSISSGGGDPADLERAAGWACRAHRSPPAAPPRSSPATATRCASASCARARADAPTVLIYGHYDVQSPDPRELWTSDPFEPVVRDGRLYARGASDDKGNFLPLLHVACELARAGELPVHVRVVLEGEEEIGGTNVLRFLEQDERGADCAIVFDGGMVDEARPAMHIAVRGIVAAHVRVRTARARPPLGRLRRRRAERRPRAHADARATSCPAPTAACATELRAGPARADARGDRVVGRAARRAPTCSPTAGATEIAPGAAAELYARTWADASLDINGIESGDAHAAAHDHPVHRERARDACASRSARDGAADRGGARAHPARGGAGGRRARARRRRLASRPASTRPIPVLALAREAIGRAAGSAAAARAHRRLDPDPRRARRSAASRRCSRASRSTPTASTGPTRATGSRASTLGERAARELYAALAALPS